MTRVKAIKQGYYDHRLIPEGAIFNMEEVDSEGYYLDEKGKRKLFFKVDKEGRPFGEGEPRKCKWVDTVKAKASTKKDPFEIAKVISGKQALSKTEIELG